MFGTVTGIIPAGSGATAVSTITAQLTADLPELLIILAGLVAVGFVLGLLRKWLRPKSH